MNAIVFGGEKGERSEVYYYSENISIRGCYLSALTLHFLWSIRFIFCVLAPEGMNAIVFGREKGERSEVYYLLGKYFYQGILFICSHITFPMIYSFYFLCFGFGRKECNESKGDYFNFLENDNPLSLYCSLKKENNLLDDISFEQVAAF